MEAFSLPTRGFIHQALHLGAHPGSLDWGKRTLPGQRGSIDNSTGAQAGQESPVSIRGPAEKQEGIWRRRKLSIKGERIGPSSRRRTEASERAGRLPALREGEFLS